MRVLDNALVFYKQKGFSRERFGTTVNRIGVGEASKELLQPSTK